MAEMLLQEYGREQLDKPPRVKLMVMKRSSKTCSICIEGFELDSIISKLPCQHIYHRGCIKTWMGKSKDCPLCRCKFST